MPALCCYWSGISPTLWSGSAGSPIPTKRHEGNAAELIRPGCPKITLHEGRLLRAEEDSCAPRKTPACRGRLLRAEEDSCVQRKTPPCRGRPLRAEEHSSAPRNIPPEARLSSRLAKDIACGRVTPSRTLDRVRERFKDAAGAR